MFVRKSAEGTWEARDGDRVVGGYAIVGEPPTGDLRLWADEAEPADLLRRHALEQARRAGFARLSLDGEVVDVPGPVVEGDELTRRTLRDSFEGERLKEMPSNPDRRRVVLVWLASRLEPGRRYTEAEVNQILLRHHPDFAMTRRYLVDWGLVERVGGIYWRDPPG